MEAPCGFRFGPSTAEGLQRSPKSISEVTCQLRICSDLVEAPCGFRFGPSTGEGLRRNPKSIIRICSDLVEAPSGKKKGTSGPEGALGARKGPLGPGRGPWGPEGPFRARKARGCARPSAASNRACASGVSQILPISPLRVEYVSSPLLPFEAISCETSSQ